MKFIFLLLTFILTFTANANYLDLDEVTGGGGGGGGAVDSVFGRTGAVSASFGDYSAFQIINAPSGNILSTTVQNAINELDLEKLALTGGTLTGDLQLNTLLDVKDADFNFIAVQAPVNIAANYTLTLPIDDGLTGQVLSTDGAGVLSWLDLPNPDIIVDADADTKIQVEEAADEDKIRFDTDNNERMIIDNVGGVGIGTSTPSGKAILDVQSITRGVAFPRMSATQRDAITSPIEGLLVYINELDKFSYFDGTAWLNFPAAWSYIEDADKNTLIQVEEGANDNTIRFDTDGTQRLVVEADGDVSVGVVEPAVMETTAAFQVDATTKGFLVPRLTTSERNSINPPAEGLLVYDETLDDFYFYDSTTLVWKPLYGLQDLDADTKIRFTEPTADTDAIRFDTLGAERMTITANGNIGVGTTTPDASALLDVSSTTKGVKLPSMTTDEREAIVSPAAGLIVYDTDFSKFHYWSGTEWFSLDNGIGHGVVGPYLFKLAPDGCDNVTTTCTDIVVDGDTLVNFQRINPLTGKIENALTVIPDNTFITDATSIGPNGVFYMGAKYDWVAGTVSFIPHLSTNNIDIGDEILLAGPFTNATPAITGYVRFYHFATDTTVGWSDDLADVERSRVVDGIQHSLILPIAPDPTDGSQYHISMATGTTFNSLLRDPKGHISEFGAKNTFTTNATYKYKPGLEAFDFFAAGTPSVIAGEYWDSTANGGLGDYAVITNNNNFTVTAFFAFPGEPSNQFVGMMVDDRFHTSIENARNEVFTGQVLDGRPQGLDAAALVGYLILKGTSLTNHKYGDPLNDGITWEFIGPRDFNRCKCCCS